MVIAKILFIDLEVSSSKRIQEIGLVFGDRSLKTTSINEAYEFINSTHTSYLAGHNIVEFDQKFFAQTSPLQSQGTLSPSHAMIPCVSGTALPVEFPFAFPPPTLLPRVWLRSGG